MLKLVVFDIDGVLLNQNLPVLEVFDLIKSLQAKGILCTVATGRSYLRALEALGDLKLNCPLIIDDGSRIISPSGQDIFSQILDEKSLDDLMPILNKDNIYFATFAPLSDQSHKNKFLYFSSEAEQFIKNQPAHLIGETTQNPLQFINWAKSLGSPKISLKVNPEKKLTMPNQINWTLAENVFYNINPPDINKGAGLIKLADILKINLNDIIVTGNDFNDLPTFRKEFGIKIAIDDGTCPPELVALATHTTPQGDLAKLLRSLL